MTRCMLCGKRYADEEVSGGICRGCKESVRREAQGKKLREKQASDRALRASGQPGEKPPRDAGR